MASSVRVVDSASVGFDLTADNVIAKLHGASDDEWVLLGNHHDAWAFGG